MNGIIYCYTNKINGKQYIGQTIHEEQRKANHKHEALKGSDYYFHRAIRKHGWDAFEYSILEECKNLSERETYYIDTLNTLWPNGYNQLREHKGMPIEIRQKISNTKKKQWLELPEEEKNKKKEFLIKIGTGKKQTEYQKKIVAEKLSGKWRITDPQGNKYEIVNLRKFERENDLNNLWMVAAGRIKQSKGWKCERL